MCIDLLSSTFRWNCIFLPYFYRKTYTNLLIFVLFVCSFFYSSIFFFFYSVFNDQSFSLLLWVVGTSGLEPPTSRLSGARSNHLSYAPLWWFRGFLIPSSTFGGDDGNRTHDPLLAGQVLSQLSYTPIGLGITFLFFLSNHRSLKIEQQVDICFLRTVQHYFLSSSLPFGLFFAYLQIRDICEWYLTFSIERRWSSRTFRYGYLVTT